MRPDPDQVIAVQMDQPAAFFTFAVEADLLSAMAVLFHEFEAGRAIGGQVVFVQSKTGLIYAYTGLGNVKVHKGDYILSGSEVGTVGIDSISQKPQMTFMVFQNGQPIDPSKAPRN